VFYVHLLKSCTIMVKEERKEKQEDEEFPAWEVVN
jgi:hypothetical protein